MLSSRIVDKPKRLSHIHDSNLLKTDTSPLSSDLERQMDGRNQFAHRWESHNLQKAHTVLNELHANYKDDKLDRIELAECLQEYGAAIQSTRRHLLLVADATKFPGVNENSFFNGSQVYWGYPFYSTDAMTADIAVNAYDWICSGLPRSLGSGSADDVCASDIEEIRTLSTAMTSDLTQAVC